jgi:hypothetical protein
MIASKKQLGHGIIRAGYMWPWSGSVAPQLSSWPWEDSHVFTWLQLFASDFYAWLTIDGIHSPRWATFSQDFSTHLCTLQESWSSQRLWVKATSWRPMSHYPLCFIISFFFFLRVGRDSEDCYLTLKVDGTFRPEMPRKVLVNVAEPWSWSVGRQS